jgi:WD40 repeat protein
MRALPHKTDLEKLIRESYRLIQEYEDMIRLSDRPKEKLRAKREIEGQWRLIESYLSEHQLLAGEDTPGNIESIARRAQSWEEELERLSAQAVFGSRKEQRAYRDRSIMLKRVQDFWIKGVLEQSLHGAAAIELEMEERADAVDHPWDLALQTERENRVYPPGTRSIDVFDEMGESLLILGDPGSGKTTTLLELGRDAIARADRDPTQPIPVIFNLSSWTERKQGLADWLVKELNVKYQIPKKIGHTWLQNNNLLLLLDGLDEVEPTRQKACIEAFQGAVLLQPLTPQQIDAYLSAAGPRLHALRAALEQDVALQELTRSPLMLSITSIAYQDASLDVLATGQPDSTEARRRHLFTTYIKQMFKHRKPSQDYTPQKTTTWLTWLAQKMAQHSQSIFMLEGLQPSWLSTWVQRWVYVMSSRLISGLLIHLAFVLPVLSWFGPNSFQGWLPGLLGVGLAITVGLIDGLRFEWGHRDRATGTLLKRGFWRWVANGWIIGLIVALAFELVKGLASAGVAQAPTDHAFNALLVSIAIARLLLGGFPLGLILSLKTCRNSIAADIQTIETLTLSWRRFVVPVLIIGVVLNGLTFASASLAYDPGANLWDESGHLIAPLKGHTGPISSVSFGSNGTRIVTASEDGTARLWDGTDGALVAVLEGHTSGVKSASFNPDGTRIVTTSADGTAARLWDGTDVTLVATLEPDSYFIVLANFSLDGTRIATAEKSGTVQLWDGRDGAHVATLGGHVNRVASANFSPDGSRILTIDRSGMVRLWRGQDGTLVAMLEDSGSRVDSASFNPDGTRIVTASDDHTVRLWNGKDGTLVAELGGLISWDAPLSFSPDGTRIATMSYEDAVHLWNGEDGTLVAELQGHIRWSTLTIFSPDGTRIATDSDGKAHLWNGEDGTLIAVLKGNADQVSSFSFSTDGTRIVTVGRTVALYDGKDGTFVATLGGHTERGHRAKFSPVGTRVVTVGGDRAAQLWDGRDGTLIASLEGHTGEISSVSFSSDGKRIVTTSDAWDMRLPLVVLWLLLGLVVGLFTGLRHSVRESKMSPSQGIWLSIRNALAVGLIAGLVAALFGGLIYALVGGLPTFWGLSRVPFPYVLRLGLSAFGSVGLLAAWWYGGLDVIQHFILRLLLYTWGNLPWNLVRFLDHASGRILLRKVGGGYIFVHRLLQEYFAERYQDEQSDHKATSHSSTARVTK